MTKNYRAPGRTELGGNHTDHQHGKVLAAGIDLFITAEAAPTENGIVKISSEGYPDIQVDLNCLEPSEAEFGTSLALVRGVAAGIRNAGGNTGGFSAKLKSDVLSGSGLSSSAAYEVLIGRIFNDMYCGGKLTDVQIAQIGQYAENVFFGKPCGLMDQMACSVGNIIAIDFKDPAKPVIERIDSRFEDYGFALCIIDTHSEHADLTGEYAAIPAEMKQIAAHFGKEVLRDVDPDEFARNKTKLKVLYGDRPVKRAEHFFAETERAQLMADALKEGRFTDYLRLVNESGRSSEELLQNIVPASHPENTAVKDSIALARKTLSGRGAARVHGGGFAGTIQAYVPLDEKEHFREEMEKILGTGSCHYLSVSR
jgi:galactokinase